MNIDISQIPHWLWAFIFSPSGVVIGIGLLSIIILKFLVGKQNEITYAKLVLKAVHELMKGQLGEKAEAVYQAWLSGLDAIADGNFTNEEMIAELNKFIKIALGKQQITLNKQEEAVVAQATSMTAEIVSVTSKSTKKAVSIMMAK